MSTGPLKHTTTIPYNRQRNGVYVGRSLHNNGFVAHSRRVLTAPSAAKGASLPAAIPAPTSPVLGSSIPSIPEAVQRKLDTSRRSWLDRCVSTPLVDPVTNSRVHVYGNVHFAPFGGMDGLSDLEELLDCIQPTILAIEQAYDLGARAGLPYPEVIHCLTSLFPEFAPYFTGPDMRAALQNFKIAGEQQQSLGPVPSPAEVPDVAGTRAGAAQKEEHLRALLPGLAQQARIGRDLIEPFEVFGMYSGCDYVTRPSQLMEALTLFGYMPGLEYAALVAAAQQRGVQVCSVDAPLRLQEKWVSQLVAKFTLDETDLVRRLQRDLDRAQSFLPPEYLSWDVALAEAVRQIERQQRHVGQQRHAEEDGLGGSGSGAGRSVNGPGSAEEPSLITTTAFKVSRAVAAATLPYEGFRDAFALQAGLQPLKYALFARRAKHLVLQVRDLCQRISMRQVRVDASKFKSPTTGVGEASQRVGEGNAISAGSKRRETALEDVALVDVSDQPEKVVLAVVGRQYMPYIEELWANERSVLWHGDVRRTFARSTLERQ